MTTLASSVLAAAARNRRSVLTVFRGEAKIAAAIAGRQVTQTAS